MLSRYTTTLPAFVACFAVALLAMVGCDKADEPVVLAAAPSSPLIALTPTEYNNTVRDLLAMPRDTAKWPSAPSISEELVAKQGSRKGIFGSAPPAPPVWPWNFPSETGVAGFEGIAKGQASSPYGIEQTQKAAMHFAQYALVSPIFFTCKDWGTLADTARKDCGWESIERFVQRAWRRPIDDGERSRLRAFWVQNWTDSTPEEAVLLTVAGILQSHHFLYRIEAGDTAKAASGVAPLTDWEMASRLSYFIWDTMPDPELFMAAAQGKLSTRAQVKAQAERMVNDPKARPAVVHFHNQWLGTDKIMSISPARRAYGQLFGVNPTPPLDTTGDGQWPAILNPMRHSMQIETDLFIEDQVFEGEGTLEGLFTSNEGYTSNITGPVLGVGTCPSGVNYPGGGPGKGGTACKLDETKVDMAADKAVTIRIGLVAATYFQSSLTVHPATFPKNERSGVLTLPAVLALGAHPVHPSPILRGKHILERIACQHIGAPPPNADAAAPPDSVDAKATNRERTEESTSAAGCAGCHSVVNPPGFAFEHYDSMGRWRKEDNGKPVNAAGTLTLNDGEKIEFGDGVELSHKLAKHARVQDCYVQHWTRYATGVDIDKDDKTLVALQKEFRGNDRIKDLLVAIAASDLLRNRRMGGTP